MRDCNSRVYVSTRTLTIELQGFQDAYCDSGLVIPRTISLFVEAQWDHVSFLSRETMSFDILYFNNTEVSNKECIVCRTIPGNQTSSALCPLLSFAHDIYSKHCMPLLNISETSDHLLYTDQQLNHSERKNWFFPFYALPFQLKISSRILAPQEFP